MRRRKRTTCVRALWAWLVVTAGMPAAADVVHELEAFTVRAWHFDGLELNYPGDVEVIDREAIEDSFTSSLPELLEQEANVRMESLTGNPTEAQVALRGFGENSGLRVLVVVDGQRINRPDLGGVEWQRVPLEDIASVEVIRGGQNVLYGNYALAGVIKVTTRRGGPVRMNLRAEGGSDGYSRGAVDHAGGKGRLFWDLGGEARESDGYRENARTWNRSLSGTIGWQSGADGRSRLSLNASATEGYVQFPGPLLREQFLEDPRQSTNVGNDETDYRTGLVTLQWDGRHDGGRSQLDAAVHVRELDLSLDGIFALNEQTTATLSPRIRMGGSEDFLIAGVDLIGDRVDYRDYLDNERDLLRARADLQQRTVGPYLFGQRFLGNGVSLSGGLRYESAVGDYAYTAFVENQLRPEIETNRGTFPNPHYQNPPDVDTDKSYDRRVTHSGLAAELSLLWRANRNWSLWTGYDRVYRYPVLDEAAAYQGFELAEPVNADLEPEKGHQVDLGVKFRQARIQFSATAFYLGLDGEIVYDDEANLNLNLGDTRRWGGEAGLRWETEQLTLSTRWSFVEARFSGGAFDGNTVPLVPSAHGVTGVRLRPVEWMEAAVFHHWYASRYQGNDFANTLRKVDAFHRIDLRLSAEGETLTAFLRIPNLLDDNHAPLAYRGAWYPAPGRQWRAGIRVSF